MRRLVEEVRVGVERDARSRMAENAADVGDVEFEVDERWLAKVWRRSCTRNGASSGRLRLAFSAALRSPRLSTFLNASPVPTADAKT